MADLQIIRLAGGQRQDDGVGIDIEGRSIPLPVIDLRKERCCAKPNAIADVCGTDSVVTVDEFDTA